jgi:hypothetical protein
MARFAIVKASDLRRTAGGRTFTTWLPRDFLGRPGSEIEADVAAAEATIRRAKTRLAALRKELKDRQVLTKKYKVRET